MMSSGLVKVAATAKSSFAQVEASARKVQAAGSAAFSKIATSLQTTNKESKYFKMSLDGLKGALDDARLYQGATRLKSEFKEATNEIKRLEKEIASMEGKKSGHSILGMGLGKVAGIIGLSAMGSSAFGFVKESVNAANQFEQTTRQYEVLTGSKAGGQELAGQLRGMKENTVMGPAVYDNARTMLAFGVQAKDVTNDLRMLGDVSLGDANRLQHLTLAFSEVQTQGKLTGKEVRQMSLQGFNPLAEMAKTTGKSMEELRRQMHDGGITSDMVTKAFASATGEGGRFHNMLNTMAETGAGKMLILKGGIASLKIAIGERLAPAVNKTVGYFSSWVHTLKELVQIPAAQKYQEQIDKIRGLQAQLTSSNTSHQQQVKLLRELEEINPNIVKGISEQNIEYSKLASNIDAVSGALRSKIFMESFDKSNVKMLTKYSDSQNTMNKNYGEIMSTIGNVAPDIAVRTDLTIGQKEMMTMQRLKGVFSKQRNGGITGDGVGTKLSKELDAHNILYQGIKEYNKAAKTANELSPAYNQFQKTKSAITSQIDAQLGLGSLTKKTAADIKGDDDGDSGNAGKKTKASSQAIGSSITGGGPRVVNIHGVKFADKIELHAATVTETLEELQKAFDDMFLRTLNSGASVQN